MRRTAGAEVGVECEEHFWACFRAYDVQFFREVNELRMTRTAIEIGEIFRGIFIVSNAARQLGTLTATFGLLFVVNL